MPYSPMDLAEAFLKTGELEDAAEALTEQLEQHPDDDVARRLYLQVQSRLLNGTQLAALVTEFAKLSNMRVEDYQLQSVLYERLEQPSDAINAIRNAVALSPSNERLTERLLDLLLSAKNYEDALVLVREQERSWRWLEREGDILVLLGNDILATARYGLVLSHLSDLEGKMQEAYLKALKARVVLARAHAYRRLGHTDVAREHYTEAQKVVGADPTIMFNLGLLTFIDGNEDEAIKLCQAAIDTASGTLRENMLQELSNNEQFTELEHRLKLQ